jgi:hypothetical protein
MENKCKIKILKKKFEGITESSINYNKALGSKHFTCSSACARMHTHTHTHTHAPDFIFHA